MSVQLLFHLLDTTEKVCSSPIHLVNKTNSGNIVLGGLPPNRFRLRLHSTDRIKHAHSTIKNPQRSFHFCGEIHMARRINNIDLMVLPETSCRRRGNGDPPLLLLLHPVHGGITIVHFANLVAFARVIENALSRCGFTRIDMCDDPNIPCFLRL